LKTGGGFARAARSPDGTYERDKPMTGAIASDKAGTKRDVIGAAS
jgi:hypothetical protein